MTREQAIKLLVNATYSEEWQGNEQLAKAQHMAIDALEQEPIIYCEDCISREYTLEKAQEWKSMYPDSDTAREALTMMMNEIDNAPSVVPKPNKEYDYSKSVLENIKAGNGISREIPKEASEDLISRQDAIDALVRSSVYAWSAEENQIAHDWALKIISELPAKESDK